MNIGTHEQTDWQTGEVKKYDDGNPVTSPEAYITFEFPTERIIVDEADRPRWLSKTYVVSQHEKSHMFKLMKAAGLDPVKDTFDKLLGKSVMVEVGSTKTDKAKIVSSSPVPKGMATAALENPEFLFDVDEYTEAQASKLPKFLKEKLDITVEPAKKEDVKEESAEVKDDFDDDIPF